MAWVPELPQAKKFPRQEWLWVLGNICIALAAAIAVSTGNWLMAAVSGLIWASFQVVRIYLDRMKRAVKKLEELAAFEELLRGRV